MGGSVGGTGGPEQPGGPGKRAGAGGRSVLGAPGHGLDKDELKHVTKRRPLRQGLIPKPVARKLPASLLAAAPSPAPMRWGMNNPDGYNEIALCYTRTGCTWGRPIGPIRNINDADTIAAAYKAAGRTPLMILDTTNPNLASQIVAKYGPKTAGGWTWFEMGNEPYEPATLIQPDVYAKQCRTLAQACRFVDAGVKLLIAGCPDWQTSGGAWVPWSDLMYGAVPDLKLWYDAVAVHPYGVFDGTSSDKGGGWPINAVTCYQQYSRNSGRGERLWVTECGVRMDEVGESAQGSYFARIMGDIRNRVLSYVDAGFTFTIHDYSGQGWGVLNDNGTPRQAANVLKLVTA